MEKKINWKMAWTYLFCINWYFSYVQSILYIIKFENYVEIGSLKFLLILAWFFYIILLCCIVFSFCIMLHSHHFLSSVCSATILIALICVESKNITPKQRVVLPGRYKHNYFRIVSKDMRGLNKNLRTGRTIRSILPVLPLCLFFFPITPLLYFYSFFLCSINKEG